MAKKGTLTLIVKTGLTIELKFYFNSIVKSALTIILMLRVPFSS